MGKMRINHYVVGMVQTNCYIVINDEVNNAADRIRAIIRAEHASTKRSAEGYIELLEESEYDNTK